MSYLFVIAASILCGIIPSIQKSILMEGISPLALISICTFFSFLVSFFLCKRKKISLKISKKELFLISILVLFGLLLTNVSLQLAYGFIPVGIVTMILFLYPSLVFIFNTIIFKEAFSFCKMFSILLSISGLFLLTSQNFSSNSIGFFLAFISTLAYCFYVIGLDKSIIKSVNCYVRTTYLSFFMFVFSFSIAVLSKSIFPSSATHLIRCVEIGIMWCMSVLLFNLGIKKLGSSTASLINILEAITSVICSSIMYDYALSSVELYGCLLIILSIIFVT